ncbi:MAG: hypothetical protein EON98_10350, partial [Chitinophagaceae bacterium]
MSRIQFSLLLLLAFAFFSCQQIIEAPVPDLKWNEFDAPGAKPLSASERDALEGIFRFEQAKDDFGDEAAVKWSYVASK